MSTPNSEFDFDVEEQTLEVKIRKPAGGVVSVRFKPEEMRELRDEIRHTGEKASALIRESTLSAIRARRAQRDLSATIQTAGPGALTAQWNHSSFCPNPAGVVPFGQIEMVPDRGLHGLELLPLTRTTFGLADSIHSDAGGSVSR